MKKRALTAGILAGVFAISSVAFAAWQTISVGVILQEYSNWCWVASTKSIKNPSASQCTIYKAGKQTTTCPNNTGTTANIDRALEYNYGSGFAITATPVSGYPTFARIVSEIGANDPFIIGRSGHAMVGYGWCDIYSCNPIGVYVMDPWYPSAGLMTYAYLISGWADTVETNR
ncbi:MAG: hypothetical protein V2A73_02275 [Pseudomonadota bacterium]